MKTGLRYALFSFLFCIVPLSSYAAEAVRPGTAEKPQFVDGVRYPAWQIDLFTGQVRFTVVEKDAVYNFTSPEKLQAFGRAKGPLQPRPLPPPGGRTGNSFGSNCSGFNKNIGCGGIDWLVMCPLDQYAHLPDSWNDVISCVQTGNDVGYYTVLYKCYDFSPYPTSNCLGQIKWVAPGVSISDLTANPNNMNNVTSSIRFCSNVDPYSCTQ